MVNKATSERVDGWQSLGFLPKGHSISLMHIGKRVLKGLVGAINAPTPIVTANT